MENNRKPTWGLEMFGKVDMNDGNAQKLNCDDVQFCRYDNIHCIIH